MTILSLQKPEQNEQRSSERANALADRLEEGARALETLASGLSAAEWPTPLPHDGRKAGVVVHHVASMYPIEMGVALNIAGGTRITGLTWDDVHHINAEHARAFDAVDKQTAIDLLRANSAAAAAAIRELGDDDLDRAVLVSMYSDAPLTCQFFLEDHAVRHSYHHLAAIRRALRR